MNNSRHGLGVLVSIQDVLKFCRFLRFSRRYLGSSWKVHYQDVFCVKISSTLTLKNQRIPKEGYAYIVYEISSRYIYISAIYHWHLTSSHIQRFKSFKPWRVTWRRTMFLLHSSRHVDIISFNTAIRACEKGSQWQQALSLMSEARHRHLQVDVICYNAVMAACSEGTQWQVAVGFFEVRGLVTESDQTAGWSPQKVVNSKGIRSPKWH